MAAITVLKENVPTGPFTREQIEQRLRSGECTLSDLAFIEGLTQWTPLGQVLSKIDGTAIPLASPLVTPPTGVPAYSYAVTMQPPKHLVYAGFWLRVWAYLVDALILSVPTIIIIVPLFVIFGGLAALASAFSQSGRHYDPNNSVKGAFPVAIILLEFMFMGITIIIRWLYFAFLESGPHQATFGKRLLSLKVTNMSGERISFGHATGRFFSKLITGLIPFGLGYIMAGFTERKQALHDLIAGTLVVRK